MYKFSLNVIKTGLAVIKNLRPTQTPGYAKKYINDLVVTNMAEIYFVSFL